MDVGTYIACMPLKQAKTLHNANYPRPNRFFAFRPQCR
jgi:hypothetical protein